MALPRDIRLSSGALSSADIILLAATRFPVNILLTPALTNNKDIKLAPAFEYLAQATSYANVGGTGYRVGEFDITQTAPLTNGVVTNLIDGVKATGNTNAIGFTGGTSNTIMMFDWGPSVSIVIDELTWTQSGGGSQGVWVIDGGDPRQGFWTQLGGSFDLGTNTVTTWAFPNSNGYCAYRLRQISGTTNATPWVEEIEFKLLDVSATPHPSYSNSGGRGNRTSAITVSLAGGLTTGGSGTVEDFVDGAFNNTCFFNPNAQTAGQLVADFGVGITEIVNGFVWRQQDNSVHGTWVFEGSNDNSVYTQIGSSFTLGGQNDQPYFFVNTTAYRYYRLRITAGATSNFPFLYEWDFRLLAGPVSPAVSGVGSSVGASTVAAVGVGINQATGSSTGASTVTGVGVGINQATAAAAGVAADSVVGAGVTGGVGASTGAGTATAVGAAIIQAIASAAGVAADSVVGVGISSPTGAAAGFGDAAGVGVSTNQAAACSSGADIPIALRVGNISPTDINLYPTAVAGASIATGVGVGINQATASSAGIGTATAVGVAIFQAVGASVSTSTVTAVGVLVIPGAGASAGVGAAAAIGVGINQATGSSTGVSTVTGVGVGINQAVASSAGVGAATAVGANGAAGTVVSGVGNAAGVATVAALSAIELTPLQFRFYPLTIPAYAEPQPANLIDGTEAFVSDTGQFTKYTESTAGTFAVASGVGTITHAGGANANLNDIITITASSFAMPDIFCSIKIPAISVTSAGYDNTGVGIVKDANNFLFASIDRVAQNARIQIKIGGTSVFKGSAFPTIAAPFELGLSLVANAAALWLKVAGVWTFIMGANITEYDFRTAGNLTGWKAGFTLASRDNATWDFDDLTWGRAGGHGMRDMTLVTNEDGTPYLDSGSVYFTATIAHPVGGVDGSHTGVFKLNMSTFAYQQTGAIMVSRSGSIYNDQAAHIIVNADATQRLLIATWGNGFSGSIQILYKATASDLLHGSNVVSSMTQLSVPGLTTGSYGAYDPMLVYDTNNARWLLAYTITQNTNFSGSPFYPADAYSTDLSTWTAIGADTGHFGYEGTKLLLCRKSYWITAGGQLVQPRVYDAASLTFQGTLDGTFSGGTDTQPHAMVFPYLDKMYLLTFDNTAYGTGAFTWGQPSLQISERFSPLGVPIYLRIGNSLSSDINLYPSGPSSSGSVGVAPGASTVTGVGVGINQATGSASGVATVTGVGVGINQATGAASGVGTATATGVGINQAIGASTGASTVTGVGGAIIAGVGNAAGIATAAAAAAAIKPATATSAGIGAATATGVCLSTAVGNAAGSSTDLAVGVGINQATGAASGIATASGAGAMIVPAVGNASGVGAAAATGANASNQHSDPINQVTVQLQDRFTTAIVKSDGFVAIVPDFLVTVLLPSLTQSVNLPDIPISVTLPDRVITIVLTT